MGFMVNKGKAGQKLREYLTFLEHQLGKRPKAVRADNGHEYLNTATCQDRFFTDLISMRGQGVRGWPSGKTEMLCSVVALPE